MMRHTFLSKHRIVRSLVDSKAMTLLEIIIVVALLGTLMTYLVTTLTSGSDSAKEDQARLGMGNIAQALQLYRVHNNRYPTTEQSLSALLVNPGSTRSWRGPYIEEEKLNDPWGVPFSYEASGREFRIISSGLDGEFGSEDDISYPEVKDTSGE
ncbi:MAG: type II secretion system major pseudopilin GspG [Proteobacteria bacterium]|nr:type II secretion system major pseudopilin GspG [Pseudomonadota bacterium]